MPDAGERRVYIACEAMCSAAAVRESLYAPTLLDGVPTPVVMTVTVTFRLRQSA